MNKLIINEGVQTQRQEESLKYKITTTPWASSPASITVEVWDITNPTAETEVTDDVITGTATVDGDEITCPNLGDLTKDHKYRMDVGFTSGGNVWAVPVIVKCIR